MSYQRLMQDHATIEALIADLLHATAGEAHPARASALLERLAVVVRDHRAREGAVLRATMESAAGDRHAATAVAAMHDVGELEEDWSQYLYRWSPDAVAGQWPLFCRVTAVMMPMVRAELAREAGILYSLAVHLGVLAAIEAPPSLTPP